MKAAVCSALLIVGTQVWMNDVWAVTIYTDRAAFEQQGTIDIQYGFEDFPAGQDVYPTLEPATETTRAHWTSHGITYDSPYSGHVDDQRLYGTAGIPGVAGRIDPEAQYTMLGFELVNNVSYSDLQVDFDITIGTNLNPNWTGALEDPFSFDTDPTRIFFNGDDAVGYGGFVGFVSDPGEYFTDFFLSAKGGRNQMGDPSIDSIVLGHTSKAVPEPHSLVLMIAGLLGLWWWKRSRVDEAGFRSRKNETPVRPHWVGAVFVGLITLVGLDSPAGAVTMITDRATFESLGVVDVNYGFEDQPVGEIETPFATHGVDYGFIVFDIVEQDGNKALGAGIGHLYRAHIDNAPMYTMFGFDVTNPDPGNRDIFRSEIQYEVGTNVDPVFINPGRPAFVGNLYEFEGTRFIGLIADPGEFFTEFWMTECPGILCYSTPTLDNVTLGHVRVAAVPEPATLVLFGAAMAGLVLLRRTTCKELGPLTQLIVKFRRKERARDRSHHHALFLLPEYLCPGGKVEMVENLFVED